MSIRFQKEKNEGPLLFLEVLGQERIIKLSKKKNYNVVNSTYLEGIGRNVRTILEQRLHAW